MFRNKNKTKQKVMNVMWWKYPPYMICMRFKSTSDCILAQGRFDTLIHSVVSNSVEYKTGFIGNTHLYLRINNIRGKRTGRNWLKLLQDWGIIHPNVLVSVIRVSSWLILWCSGDQRPGVALVMSCTEAKQFSSQWIIKTHPFQSHLLY